MMRVENYMGRAMKVLEKRSLSAETILLRLAPKDKKPFSFLPGQFVMLSVLGFGEVPVGIATSPEEKGYFEVSIRSVGGVTQKICSLKKGDEVRINGPFGNGFPISKLKGKDVVLISGGIGLVPLRSLIHHGQKKKFLKSLTILNGARTPDLLLYKDEYKDWEKVAALKLIVDKKDKNWKGPTGQITKLFDEVEVPRGAVIIVCGPPVMFGAVAERFAGKRVADSDLYFLLERRMKCGVGKCQHCTCGSLYICLDGPVFSYDQLKYNPDAFK